MYVMWALVWCAAWRFIAWRCLFFSLATLTPFTVRIVGAARFIFLFYLLTKNKMNLVEHLTMVLLDRWNEFVLWLLDADE